jgi:hypothetical protein
MKPSLQQFLPAGMAQRHPRFAYWVRLSLAFSLGAIVTLTAFLRFSNNHFDQDLLVCQPCDRMLESVSLLESLRKDRIDAAIALTEWQLDQSILDIYPYIEYVSRRHDARRIRLMIGKAKAYRALHPSLIEIPELQETLQAVLNFGIVPDDESVSVPPVVAEQTGVPFFSQKQADIPGFR